MQYYYRLYHWQNGDKSHDYTPYMTVPIFIEDKLDETLDTAKVVLECVPTSPTATSPIGKVPFAPKTKFRLERYTSDPNIVDEYGNVPIPQKYWDYCIEHDDVECPATLPDLCTHHLYLIEASVVAQGMHVDNIALTYELQDVALNYRTTFNPDDVIGGRDGNVLTVQDGGHGF